MPDIHDMKSESNPNSVRSDEILDDFTENTEDADDNKLKDFYLEDSNNDDLNNKKRDENLIGIFTLQAIICVFISIIAVVSNICFREEFTYIKSEIQRLSTSEINTEQINNIKNEVLAFFDKFKPIQNTEEQGGQISDIQESSNENSDTTSSENLSEISSENQSGSSLTESESQVSFIEAVFANNLKETVPVEELNLPLSFKTDIKLPLNGVLSSSFGYRDDPFDSSTAFHRGIDIAAEKGTKIYAAYGGTVTMAKEFGTLGLSVEIDHGNGLKTIYGHCSKLTVTEGDKVKKGEYIAKVGSTGRSTGNHLHFEVRMNDICINPILLLPDAANA